MTYLLNNDNEQLSNHLLPFNVWYFGSAWILLHIIVGLLLDYYLLNIDPQITIPIPLSTSPEQGWTFLAIIYRLKGTIFNIVRSSAIGGIEWYLLNRYFEWPKLWVVVTFIATILSGYWFSFTQNFMSTETMVVIFFVREIVSGGIFGSAQWVVLRKEVYRAYLWIFASVLGGFIGALLVEGIFQLGFLESMTVDYSIALMIYELFRRFANEAIKVACLIILLHFSLKQDRAVTESV